MFAMVDLVDRERAVMLCIAMTCCGGGVAVTHERLPWVSLFMYFYVFYAFIVYCEVKNHIWVFVLMLNFTLYFQFRFINGAYDPNKHRKSTPLKAKK